MRDPLPDEGSEPIGFYNFGVAYLDVARSAVRNSSELGFFDPIEFLLAHGLELIFKADLRRTKTLQSVRMRYGHSLPRLFKDLSNDFRTHFDVGSELAALVDHLAVGHSGPNWRNRYLETGYRPNQPLPEKMLDIVSKFDISDRKWLVAHFVRHLK